MDFSFISIAIILIIVCTLPFALYSISNNKKRKIKIQNLDKKAKENKANIQDQDIWNNFNHRN